MSEEETSKIERAEVSPYPARQAVADRMAAAGTSATTRPDWTVAAIVVILFIALLLRLWGVNWDGGLHLHPDERFARPRIGYQNRLKSDRRTLRACDDSPDFMRHGFLPPRTEQWPCPPV